VRETEKKPRERHEVSVKLVYLPVSPANNDKADTVVKKTLTCETDTRGRPFKIGFGAFSTP